MTLHSNPEGVGAAIRRMQTSPLDLLVVGGGIVGAAVARDPAQRGLRVGLVDQADFAFGTSSRSSRLLHGGLRYLSQGRIGLVREASLEKRRLHEIAPHLAEPLAFIFPTYRGSGWPLWQLHIGVRLYDLLCNNRNLGRSSMLGREALLACVPGLRTEKLAGAVRCFDALTNDARLVVDTLRSAEDAGALLANHTRFLRADRAGAGWKAWLQPEGPGDEIGVEARGIINATGPWSDRVQHSAVRLRLTKGIHLVLDRSRLPVTDAVVLTEGKRLLSVIPWGERPILGTTDTDYAGDPAHPTCDDRDVDYLLATANEAFPRAGLIRQDVIRSWVGLRPLVANENGDPSDISRSHEILHPDRLVGHRRRQAHDLPAHGGAGDRRRGAGTGVDRAAGGHRPGPAQAGRRAADGWRVAAACVRGSGAPLLLGRMGPASR